MAVETKNTKKQKTKNKKILIPKKKQQMQ